MNLETYLNLKNKVIKDGYETEVVWAENIPICNSAEKFLDEYIWVVLSAGMKNQVARKIYGKIQEAIQIEMPIAEVFGHKQKVKAIEDVRSDYKRFFECFIETEDKLDYLETLPWIGKITKYHLAKNLGIDCIKPDRHLVRIAKTHNITCLEMCQKLSSESGDNLATIDTVIWRAANLGHI